MARAWTLRMQLGNNRDIAQPADQLKLHSMGLGVKFTLQVMGDVMMEPSTWISKQKREYTLLHVDFRPASS